MMQTHVERITEIIQAFPHSLLKAPGLAILACVYARLGSHEQTREILTQAQELLDSMVDRDKQLYASGWVELFACQALSYQFPSESKIRKAAFNDIYNKLAQKGKQMSFLLQQMEDDLEKYEDIDTFSQHISRERLRIKPGKNSAIQMQLDAIAAFYKTDNPEQISKDIIDLLEHIRIELTSSKTVDYSSLACLFYHLVEFVNTMERGGETQELLSAFVSLANDIPPLPGQAMISNYYLRLIRLILT